MPASMPEFEERPVMSFEPSLTVPVRIFPLISHCLCASRSAYVAPDLRRRCRGGIARVDRTVVWLPLRERPGSGRPRRHDHSTTRGRATCAACWSDVPVFASIGLNRFPTTGKVRAPGFAHVRNGSRASTAALLSRRCVGARLLPMHHQGRPRSRPVICDKADDTAPKSLRQVCAPGHLCVERRGKPRRNRISD
jgi:hypothetical protein